MLRRCAATLVATDFSSFADSAPGIGRPGIEGMMARGGSGPPSPVRCSRSAVILRS